MNKKEIFIIPANGNRHSNVPNVIQHMRPIEDRVSKSSAEPILPIEVSAELAERSRGRGTDAASVWWLERDRQTESLSVCVVHVGQSPSHWDNEKDCMAYNPPEWTLTVRECGRMAIEGATANNLKNFVALVSPQNWRNTGDAYPFSPFSAFGYCEKEYMPIITGKTNVIKIGVAGLPYATLYAPIVKKGGKYMALFGPYFTRHGWEVVGGGIEVEVRKKA